MEGGGVSVWSLGSVKGVEERGKGGESSQASITHGSMMNYSVSAEKSAPLSVKSDESPIFAGKAKMNTSKNE